MSDRLKNKNIRLEGGAENAPFADRESDTSVRGVLIEHVMDAVRHQIDEE